MSSSTSRQSKAAALADVQALIAGTKQHFPNGSVTFGNTAYQAASLIQLLQGLADAMTALNAAELAAKDAMGAKLTMAAKVDPVIQVYRSFIKAMFAGATQTLADFGIAPPKVRTPLTSVQKAAAAAKAEATRKARGTTSKKQKLAVTGDVTGVIVTPVTSAPAATEPSAQQAPTANATAPAPTAAATASK